MKKTEQVKLRKNRIMIISILITILILLVLVGVALYITVGEKDFKAYSKGQSIEFKNGNERRFILCNRRQQ